MKQEKPVIIFVMDAVVVKVDAANTRQHNTDSISFLFIFVTSLLLGYFRMKKEQIPCDMT
ncbi:MAG: hypothetical protein PUB98_08330 [Clostridiales bacterium]|nr:hypothetical protein [Clostridiales bacterium]